jgi:hypothetical protein
MSTDDRSDSSPASSPAGVAAEAVRARVAEMPIRRAADTAAQQPPAPNRAAAPRAGRLLLAGAMGVAVTLGWMAWPESSPSRPQAAASVAQDDVMAAPAEQPEMSPDPARDAAAVKTLIEPAGTKEPARAELTAPALGPPPTVNAAPPPDLAAPTPEPTPAQIKREFDAFLNRAGRDTAKLTPASREALFREYLQWRIRASLAGP